MIDIKLLRDDPDLVRASQRARGEDEGVVDAIREADERRRASLTSFERLRAEQKSMGKDVAKAQGEEKQALLARTKELSAQVKTLAGAGRRGRRPSSTASCGTIGNVVEPEVPSGGEDDYVVVETLGTPRDFAADGFEPRDHLAARRGPRRHRHGARREGRRRPVLLPQGRRRPPRDGAAPRGDAEGDRSTGSSP